MRSSALVALGACLLVALPLAAQKEKREPLTEAQAEKIRDAGIDPNERVKLYTQFLEEHAATIKSLTARVHSAGRSRKLDDELQDFTALMDELGSNLDMYSERKADIRKSLKGLSEAAPRWLVTLRALAGEAGFDVSRKEAIESCDDLTQETNRMLTEQTTYFAQHKDEQGQDRYEPKP